MSRTLAGWLLVPVLLCALPLGAQIVLPEEELDEAVLALSTQIEVERELLDSDRARYLRHIRARRQANLGLERLYTRLDEVYARLLRQELGPEEAGRLEGEMEDLETEIRAMEVDLRETLEEGWRLRERLRERGMRMALLQTRVDEMQARLPARQDTISGTWRVRLLPMDATAVFQLRQRGTLLEGQYQTQGGRSGSFTGTVIGDRVTMQQIDSTYGRDSTYYGTLKGGNERIEGTWESINLAGGRPGFGTWTATRVREQAPAAPPPPSLPPEEPTP
jgi:hypothetical protein